MKKTTPQKKAKRKKQEKGAFWGFRRKMSASGKTRLKRSGALEPEVLGLRIMLLQQEESQW